MIPAKAFVNDQVIQLSLDRRLCLVPYQISNRLALLVHAPQEAAVPQPKECLQDDAMKVADEPAEAASEDDPGKDEEPIPVAMEVHYSIPSSARKALAHAIGKNIGAYPSYQAAPSFACTIGEYTLDRNGVLIGPRNSQLLLILAQDGYKTKQKATTISRRDAGRGCRKEIDFFLSIVPQPPICPRWNII